MALFKNEMSLISGPARLGRPAVGNAQKSIQSASSQALYPLTKSQEGMWNDYLADPFSTKYNLTLEWDLQRRDRAVLATEIVQVINVLTARHATFRSSIRNVGNKPHLIEYRDGSVDPEIRLIQRGKSTITEVAVKELLHRPILLDQELPARWLILQAHEVFRVYVTGHHIIADGQSMSILSNEFLLLLDNLEVKLPPAMEFKNMHMMERAWAETDAYVEARSSLLDQINSSTRSIWPAHLSPQSSKSAWTASYRSIDAWASFPKSELDQWSQIYKTSWFRVATALVGLLVADRTRPSRGNEEVLSVGFGGRPQEMQSSCIGQFANALPVKLPLWYAIENCDGSFRSLVAALGKNIRAVKKAEIFSSVDLARSARESGLEYEPPRVAVTYSPKLAREECRLFPVEGAWDLFVCFLEYADDVKLGVIYDPKIFSAGAIDDMKTRWKDLTRLSLTDGVKLRDMLSWLPQYVALPLLPTNSEQKNPLIHVHHWFDAHAEASPSAAALSSKEMGTMTYGELYRSTEKKAHFLLNQEVSPEGIVLIHVQRGFHVIEWILAILKSGAAFVYLDVDAPESQKDSIIENCKPGIIIDEITLELYNQKSMELTVNSVEVETRKFGTTDSNLAYIIYTSGSTGKPKGVMVEHGHISSFVKAAADCYKCGFGSRILQLASFTFDASILEWTTALCTGGCLCFAEQPKHLVGDYLAEVIEENRISFMQITPTALETLPVNRTLPSLRLISVGGEAVSRELLTRWHSRVDIVNAYGPTEAAIAVSFNKIQKGNDQLPETVTVGSANPGTTISILAEGFGAILGPGRLGEVCISGLQVVRGYCLLAEQTARNFAMHNGGARMYRTGDKGQMLEDGSIAIMGRMDRELKIRGFRIAPEEIEKAIFDTKAGVLEASVLPSEDGRELVAVVAPISVSTDSLLQKLRTILAPYKLPSRFIRVASLPKNSSGKTDHSAVRREKRSILSQPLAGSLALEDSLTDSNSDSSDSQYTEDDEKTIGEIWAHILGQAEPPASNINFFDIGGHSLLVPKLHEKLKAAFPNKLVRLVDLFHQSTIRNQVSLVGSPRAPKRSSKKTKKVTMDSSSRSHSRLGRESRTSRSRASTISRDSSKLDSDHRRSFNPAVFSETPSRRSRPITAATSVVGDETDGLDGVAVIGIAGRFPGAQNADEFYKNLVQGYSGIRTTDHSSERKTLPGNLWVPQAGTLDYVEDFDHEFWNLTEEEATEMDPQQRIFLEIAYEALTDAGCDVGSGASSNLGSRVGLFVGCANNSYHLYTESVAKDPFLRENRPMIAPSISARTAYHLNIRGPNVTVQTNCASSTVALSLAFDSLRLGRCDVAVVGGVSIQLFEGGYVTQKGQIFSPQGVCRPFDAKADGTVPADAVTCVVLKRYSTAVVDNTPVYARILGTAIGSDGASEKAGYQVPSPRGQADVIKYAWETAGRPPSKLRYAEIHGSGTPIGDALELEGLALAVKELQPRQGRHEFTVGSVKGNIGNAQHASGLVSVIKMCKSMQSGVIPRTKGLTQPNMMINPDLPINLAMSETKLRMDDIMAVSASGWGGVDSHIILAFPHEEQLLKRSTIGVPEGTFNRKCLQAPRLKTSVMLPTHSLVEEVRSEELREITGAFVRASSKLLGASVEADSNLKALGMTSLQYVSLVSAVAQDLNGPNIGAIGFTAAEISPAVLAQLYIARAAASFLRRTPGTVEPQLTVIRNRSKDSMILFLPGSGGILSGAAALFDALDNDTTVAMIEHPRQDPCESYVGTYTELVASAITAEVKKLVVVGVSMGGAFALKLAIKIRESDLAEVLQVALLDSPLLEGKQVLDGLGFEVLYIGARSGEFGSHDDTEQNWRKLLPQIRVEALDCGHWDVWGPSHATQTAALISEFHTMGLRKE